MSAIVLQLRPLDAGTQRLGSHRKKTSRAYALPPRLRVPGRVPLSSLPAGHCPSPPRLRGEWQGSTLHPGPARAAPEGLAPLDTLSRLRAGRGLLPPFTPRAPPYPPRLRGERQGSTLHPGPARAAPEGLAPLDTLSRLRAGRGLPPPFTPRAPTRQNGGGPERHESPPTHNTARKSSGDASTAPTSPFRPSQPFSPAFSYKL